MWELDHKERWAPKSWCFWTVVLEKSPLVWKKIQLVHPKGNQSWIFIGRTDAEAETPILWLPDAKNWLTGKDLDAGKDWRQEKGMTEDEMVEWHHRLDGHEFGQALGVGDRQGSLACCSPWGLKESDTTDRLNWTDGTCWVMSLKPLQAKEAQSECCSVLTLCSPMDYIVHGIFQARILAWVAIPFSRRSFQPSDQTQVSHIADRFFIIWATREAQYWSG